MGGGGESKPKAQDVQGKQNRLGRTVAQQTLQPNQQRQQLQQQQQQHQQQQHQQQQQLNSR